MGTDKHRKAGGRAKWRGGGDDLIQGSASQKRFKEANRPPQDDGWMWHSRSMLASPAWMALPLNARRVIDRLALEHLEHGRLENGRLIVTSKNFQAYGVRHDSIADAIAQAEALGFVDVTVRGRPAWSAGGPMSSQYGLTWLPRCDCTGASNRWRNIATAEQANEILQRVADERNAERKRQGAEQKRRAAKTESRAQSGPCKPWTSGPKTGPNEAENPATARAQNGPTFIDLPTGGPAECSPPPPVSDPARANRQPDLQPNLTPRILADGTLVNVLVRNPDGTMTYRHGHDGQPIALPDVRNAAAGDAASRPLGEIVLVGGRMCRRRGRMVRRGVEFVTRRTD